MSNGQSPATVDNLLAQMRQTQNSLNGWDVVFNLLDNPVNAIFQMEFAGTPNRAWKQVTIAYCQVFPNPDGGGQLAVYTALDVTLSQPLLQFGSGHKSVADIRFLASGEFKTAVQRVSAGFDPARDANPNDSALKWTSAAVDQQRFNALVPLSVVHGGIAGGPGDSAVILDFPGGSFESPVFEQAKDSDKLKEEVRTYFANNNVQYVINRVSSGVLNQLPSLTPQSFKPNILTTNSGKEILQLYITTDGAEQTILTIEVNEPIPDGYDFSLMISRRIAQELGGASAKQVSLFALENLIFPGPDLINLGPEYTAGDIVVLGNVNVAPRIAKMAGDNQSVARTGFDPPGGVASFAPLQVLISNALGAPKPGAQVTFAAGNHPSAMAVQLDPGGISGVTATSDRNGIATLGRMNGASVDAYYDIGPLNITATVEGGASVSFALTVAPTPPPPILPGTTVSIVSGDHQSVARSGFDVPGGTAMFGPLQVIVRDPSNHPVPNAEVNFEPGAAPGLMAVQVDPSGASPAVSITDRQGIATLKKLSGSGVCAYYDIGPFTVIASVAGGGSATFSLTVAPTPPPPPLTGVTLSIVSGDSQRASRSGSEVPGGTATFGPLQVALRDSGNRPVPNAPVNFAPGDHPNELAVQVDPSGGSPATVLTDSNGIATLNRMPDRTGVAAYYGTGAFTVVASVAGGASATFHLAVV